MFQLYWLLVFVFQNAEVTRQMTVVRAAQGEVETVRREMEERLKAAQEAVVQKVGHRCMSEYTYRNPESLHVCQYPCIHVSWLCLSVCRRKPKQSSSKCSRLTQLPAEQSQKPSKPAWLPPRRWDPALLFTSSPSLIYVLSNMSLRLLKFLLKAFGSSLAQSSQHPCCGCHSRRVKQ